MEKLVFYQFSTHPLTPYKFLPEKKVGLSYKFGRSQV